MSLKWKLMDMCNSSQRSIWSGWGWDWAGVCLMSCRPKLPLYGALPQLNGVPANHEEHGGTSWTERIANGPLWPWTEVPGIHGENPLPNSGIIWAEIRKYKIISYHIFQINFASSYQLTFLSLSLLVCVFFTSFLLLLVTVSDVQICKLFECVMPPIIGILSRYRRLKTNSVGGFLATRSGVPLYIAKYLVQNSIHSIHNMY